MEFVAAVCPVISQTRLGGDILSLQSPLCSWEAELFCRCSGLECPTLAILRPEFWELVHRLDTPGLGPGPAWLQPSFLFHSGSAFSFFLLHSFLAYSAALGGSRVEEGASALLIYLSPSSGSCFTGGGGQDSAAARSCWSSCRHPISWNSAGLWQGTFASLPCVWSDSAHSTVPGA